MPGSPWLAVSKEFISNPLKTVVKLRLSKSQYAKFNQAPKTGKHGVCNPKNTKAVDTLQKLEEKLTSLPTRRVSSGTWTRRGPSAATQAPRPVSDGRARGGGGVERTVKKGETNILSTARTRTRSFPSLLRSLCHRDTHISCRVQAPSASCTSRPPPRALHLVPGPGATGGRAPRSPTGAQRCGPASRAVTVPAAELTGALSVRPAEWGPPRVPRTGARVSSAPGTPAPRASLPAAQHPAPGRAHVPGPCRAAAPRPGLHRPQPVVSGLSLCRDL